MCICTKPIILLKKKVERITFTSKSTALKQVKGNYASLVNVIEISGLRHFKAKLWDVILSQGKTLNIFTVLGVKHPINAGADPEFLARGGQMRYK